MKKQIIKDLKKRKVVKKFENKKIVLKSLILNNNFKNFISWNAYTLLISLPKNSSKTRIVKRCIFTGKKSCVNKNFKLSRFFFLKFARFCFIPGLNKSTW